MGTPVNFNGSSYTVPASGERKWGTQTSNLLIALANNALSKAGGNFTLTADTNFGATYGLIVKYLKSASSNISTTGVVRLANTDKIAFRNNANGADLSLGVSTSDRLQFESVNIPTISSTDTLTNKTIAAGSNTITGLAKSDVGLGNVDNTSDSTKNSASATLTNKTFGDSVIFTNISTPSTPSAGTGRFYFKSDKPTYLDSSGNERIVANTTDSLSNPMTTVDDIIVGGSSGVATRKAKGSNNTVWAVDNSGVLAYTGTPRVTSISFGGTALANYEEGTWTPAEASKTNLTGTGSYGTATYTRIGNMVFARIETISGYSITTTATNTKLVITTTGLPGVANSTPFYGTALTSRGGTPITASVSDNAGGSTNFQIDWLSNGTGTVDVGYLNFTYKI